MAIGHQLSISTALDNRHCHTHPGWALLPEYPCFSELTLWRQSRSSVKIGYLMHFAVRVFSSSIMPAAKRVGTIRSSNACFNHAARRTGSCPAFAIQVLLAEPPRRYVAERFVRRGLAYSCEV